MNVWEVLSDGAVQLEEPAGSISLMIASSRLFRATVRGLVGEALGAAVGDVLGVFVGDLVGEVF